MAGRVEEDAERRARLVLRLRGAEAQHVLLAAVEVVDDHVEVHLLRSLLSRPLRRSVVVDRLEGDAVAPVSGPDLHPSVLGGDVPLEQPGIELRERIRVRAVDDESREPGDGHVAR